MFARTALLLLFAAPAPAGDWKAEATRADPPAELAEPVRKLLGRDAVAVSDGAAVLTVWFLARGPWWGITWVSSGWQPMLVGRFLQNSDTVGALLALGVLGWTLARPAGGRAGQPDRSLVDHAR